MVVLILALIYLVLALIDVTEEVKEIEECENACEQINQTMYKITGNQRCICIGEETKWEL